MPEFSATAKAARTPSARRKHTRLRFYPASRGGSGVVAHESGPDFIIVEFKSHGAYLYNHVRPGRIAVEKMKQLARQGAGLATYINQNVRENYAKKLR